MFRTGRNIGISVILVLVFIVAAGFCEKSIRSTDENTNQLKYNKLDDWYSREIQESSIIGGKTIQLFEVGNPGNENKSYPKNFKDANSPWSTTNIYAKMCVEIANPSVFPEKREDGFCCRMETNIRKINILGLKLEVLVSGALFLGELIEPVTNVRNPIRKLNHGVPFYQKPQAIEFDYKYIPGEKRVHAVYKSKEVPFPDKAEVCMILQKRWEDEKGNVFASRIGGTRQFLYGTNGQWKNKTSFPVFYGDITKEPFYNPEIMSLIPNSSELFVKNSKGEMVPLVETSWGDKNDEPTHLVLYFASSFEGIEYKGSPNSKLWIDNIEFVY